MGSARSADDRGFRLGTGAVASLVVLLVLGIFFVLARDSRLSIAKFGFSFWKGTNWDPVSGDFGALPFIWGTLYSSLLAVLVSTPIALGIAIFISELSPRALKAPLRFLTELLAAVPSIVYGLWGIFVLVPLVRRVEAALPESLKALPFFSGPPLGVGMAAAVAVLSIMIVPYSSSVAREVLKAVPGTQREAAYALGATRWEAIQAAVSFGKTGILGAVLLGLGRALGETMAVTMLIGNAPSMSLSLLAPQATMASVLANEITEAADDLYLHALVEIGLVLFLITLLINAISRFLISRIGRGVVAPAAPPVAVEALKGAA